MINDDKLRGEMAGEGVKELHSNQKKILLFTDKLINFDIVNFTFYTNVTLNKSKWEILFRHLLIYTLL